MIVPDGARPRRAPQWVAPAQPAEPAPLRVVRPGERSARSRQRRARWMLAGAVTVFAGLVFGLVGVHVMLAQNQMRLDRLDTQAAADQVRYERLRLQVAQLASPARIVAEATNHGFVQPPGITYLNPPMQPATGTAAAAAASASASAPTSSAASDWTEIKPELAAHP